MELYDNFSDKSKMILDQAFTEARNMNMNYVGSEHLLLSLLKIKSGIIDRVKRYNQLTYKDVKKECLRFVGIGLVQREIQGYSRRATEILKLASFEANSLKALKVEPEHILLALLDQVESTAVKVVEKIGCSAFDLKTDVIKELDSLHKKAEKEKQEKIEASLITKFGVDMTNMAKLKRYDPVIGRDQEMNRVVQILGRKTKNNPCLIGEPGVGKSAIIEGIAQKIMKKDVPDYLIGKRIVSINLAALLAGSKFRGEFEDRLTQLIDEVKKRKDIVLFIDEIHTLVGAGATNGAMDAANILKPFISRDDIQLIGATTTFEYRKHIEKDTALERRLQPVKVEEPSLTLCLEMLKGLKVRYENYHNLIIDEDTLHQAVHLSSQYIHDRYLPDKALDLIDEAASRCKLDGEEVVTSEKIKEIVALWTGIPLEHLTVRTSDQLLRLENQLNEQVVGQPLASHAVAKAIIRSRVGLKDQSRPMGSFLFLGSTGVGKTALAKALSKSLFGDEKQMIRLDMSEYMEKHSVSKIIGSPPGYMGHEAGGQLTERVRTQPYAVILFDEIEKAHPDVLNILLQLLDEGHLTDAKGRQVSFKQTIVILTSNVGVENIKKKKVGFAVEDTETDEFMQFEEQMQEELKKHFKSELLNRLDEVIIFRSLNRKMVYQIIEHALLELKNRVNHLGYGFKYEEDVVSHLYDIGYSETYGVRSIQRAITRLIENPIAEIMLVNELDYEIKAFVKHGKVQLC